MKTEIIQLEEIQDKDKNILSFAVIFLEQGGKKRQNLQGEISHTKRKIKILSKINITLSLLKSNEQHGIKRLFIKIKNTVIDEVKHHILQLNNLLKKKGIQLIVEVEDQAKKAYIRQFIHTIYYLYENDVTILLRYDYATATKTSAILLCGCVDIIKVSLPDDFFLNKERNSTFTNKIFNLREQYNLSILIDNINTIENRLALDIIPFDCLQGSLFNNKGYVKFLN